MRTLPIAAALTLATGLLAPALAGGPAFAGPAPAAFTAAAPASDGGIGVQSAALGATARTPRTAELLARARTVDPRVDRTVLTFFAGLPRDRQRLQAAATKAATPGLLEYRDFATLNAAAKKYGATAKAILQLRNAGEKAGVTVTVDRSGLFARMSAPVATWNKLYGSPAKVTEPTDGFPYRSYLYVDAKQVAGAPKVFAGLTKEWQAIYSAYAPVHDVRGIDPQEQQGLQQLLDSTGSPKTWPLNTGTLPTDTCGQAAMEKKAVYAPSQIRKAYGSTALASQGMTGKDVRMTVISLGGGFATADLEAAAHCFGYAQPAITVTLGTGVGEAFRNASPETHLDLITASSVLPGAASLTLVESVQPNLGITDGLARALDYDGKGTTSPDVISLSYGLCESDFAADTGVMTDLNQDLLKMAAMVGSSVLVAAGDHGSSMCSGTTSPSVWYPASSPWVTAVGGTRLTLTADNTRASETSWNDSSYAPDALAAGGGGPSALFGHAWYQPALTIWSPRMVPDVSVLGAIRPGWPIYYGGTLYTVGGTSGGTPFLAANIGLMAAAERAKGFPTIGFLNGWLYGASTRVRNFFDVTTGGTSVQPVSCCAAYRGYDMATGLGVPQLAELQKALVPPAG